MENKIRYYKQNGEEYSFSKEPQIKIMQTSNADMNIGIPKKQTAVEWLEDTINQMIYNGGDLGEDEHALRQHIQQAKAMEKEQHGDTWNKALDAYEDRGYLYVRAWTDFDDHYRETYGK